MSARRKTGSIQDDVIIAMPKTKQPRRAGRAFTSASPASASGGNWGAPRSSQYDGIPMPSREKAAQDERDAAEAVATYKRYRAQSTEELRRALHDDFKARRAAHTAVVKAAMLANLKTFWRDYAILLAIGLPLMAFAGKYSANYDIRGAIANFILWTVTVMFVFVVTTKKH